MRKGLLVLCSLMVLFALAATPGLAGVATAAPEGPAITAPEAPAAVSEADGPRDPQVKQMAPGWRYTPAARPAAPAGTGVTDGGFEYGSPNPFWSEYSQRIGTPICSPDICGNAGGAVFPRTGDYYLWFGGNLFGDNGYVEQQITIPPTTPILTFQMWIELAGAHDTDYLKFLLDGAPIYSADVRRSNRAYQFVAVDLSAKAGGQPHTLRIEAATHGPANFLVDDIALTGAIGPSSLAKTGPEVGIVNIAYPFTAKSPQYTTTPITYTWDSPEQTGTVHSGAGLTDQVNFTFAITGDKVITVTAANHGGRVTGLQHMYVEPEPQISVVSAAALPALRDGSVDWGDFDNDGQLDVLMTGRQWNSGAGSYAPVTLLYRNNGDGSFSPVTTGLPGILDGAGRWGDFNNDDKLDVLLVGWGPSSAAYTHLFRNDGPAGQAAWTFTDTGEPFTPLSVANAAWADYNADGKLDFIITGLQGALGPNTVLYTNLGGPGWHFSANADADLPTLYDGTMDWGDVNQDGLPDLLLTGCRQDNDNCQNHITEIYRNQGWDPWSEWWTFVDTRAGLSNVGRGAARWTDYDGDGLQDVALAGCVNSTGAAVCDANVGEVWHNDGDEYFSKRADMVGVRNAALSWGDFDNDGRPDILLSGDAGTSYTAAIYQYNGNHLFTDIRAGLNGAAGTATWADYDQDAVLDVLLTGQTGGAGSDAARLYANTAQPTNTQPGAPGELTVIPELDGAHLSWGLGSDRETPAEGLTYNLRIGTTPGGSDVLGPMADAATGMRRIVARGNAPSSRQFDIRGLASGTKYYWSLQTIDGAFAGSPFAAEGSFTTLVPTPPSAVTLSGPDAGAVTTANTSYVYTFTANIEPISATQPFTYTWTADGQSKRVYDRRGRTFSQSYAWNTAGPKVVTVTARNARGVVTATHTINVGLPIDSLQIAGPTAAVIDQSYTFTVTASPEGVQQPITYIWDVTDNGRQQSVRAGLTQSKTFTWRTSGRKAVRVIAQNALGSVIKTLFVNIDVPVTGVSLAGKTRGVIGVNYTFTGSVNPLTATLPITYTWSATGAAAADSSGHLTTDTHSFSWATPGAKVVTLVAKNLNGQGLVNTTRTILIEVPLTSVGLTGPAQAAIGQSYTFNATAGPTNATTPITYTWAATGQAPQQITGGGAASSHAFTWDTPGTKHITVTAQNAWTTVTGTLSVVANAGLGAVSLAGPTLGGVGQSYTFTATGSPISAMLPCTYTWTATGQTAKTGAGHGLTDQTSFTWTSGGKKTITVVAKNPLSTVTASHDITITVPVNSAAITGRAVGVAGIGYEFVATAGPSGVTTPLTFVWETAGQTPITHTVNSATDRVTFSWPDKGPKTVHVTITNALGAASRDFIIKIGFGSYLPMLKKP